VALTGLDIYKKLPKTNCGDCGLPTCLAFAMKLAGGQAKIEACPHVSEDAKAELAEASAPPVALVTIGKGDRALQIGGETVLFRHEKTFLHPPGFAILIKDDLSDEEVEKKVNQINELALERIGQMLRADLVAIESQSDAERFAQVSEKVSKSTDFPLVLISKDPEAMKKAVSLVSDANPLIYAADKDNYEAMASLAKEHSCPLAVSGSDGLEALAELTEKIAAMGVKNLVLDPGSGSTGQVLKDLVFIRRVALKKKYRPLGYPVITFPCRMTDDDYMEAVLAGVHIMKYAGIIVLNNLDVWKMLPLMVLRQNIYTDPQRPMQVEEGIYEIGTPDKNSPVLVTTNFSLTYFIVTGEIEASKISAWLCVMDVEGLSVLTAWAAGKFIPEKIASFIGKSGIGEKVGHRTLTIPGYVAQISGELEEELSSEWKVQVGSREAGDIPGFLKQWSA
jgi:acetyl-CoA decarbonylase/synthase complex subunit gamma